MVRDFPKVQVSVGQTNLVVPTKISGTEDRVTQGTEDRVIGGSEDRPIQGTEDSVPQRTEDRGDTMEPGQSRESERGELEKELFSA